MQKTGKIVKIPKYSLQSNIYKIPAVKGTNMTEVHLYNRKSPGELDYFADDLNPGVNIGKMLSLLKEEYGDIDLILDGGDHHHKPIAIKKGDTLYYDFYQYEIDKDIYKGMADILERVPSDSYWSQLIEEETIDITENPSDKDDATRLLKEMLVSHDREVGVFFTGNNKLATLILPRGIKEAEVYVAENSVKIPE